MPASELSAWRRTLARHLLALVLAAVSGLALGHPWPALALAAIAMLGWHLWRLRRILARLAARRRPPPPRGNGAWDGLERLLRDAHDGLRGHRLRLLSLLRAYRAAADALPDAVVVLERNSQRVRWFNRAASHLLGLRAPQDTGAPLAQRLQPLQLAGWLSQGRHAEPIPDAPSPVSPDARLHLRLLPYSDELWLLVARDVSRVTRLEQMRRDFVANVSHELRTPIASLKALVETLLDGALEDEEVAHEFLARMETEVDGLARLVQDLLELSRAESGRLTLSPVAADIRRVAEQVIARLRTQAEPKKLDIRIEIPDGLPPGRFDPERIEQVLVNLVHNAVKFTPPGGIITVGAAAEDDHLVVWVADTGPGVAPEDRDRIFERFYKTDRSRADAGTGLGLSIARHLVELHGGRIWVDGTARPGTTIKFTLPLALEPAPTGDSTPSAHRA